MNQVLEYLNNYPEQTKRVIGITDIQLIKLIENAQKKESEVKEVKAVDEKRLIKAGGGRKKLLSSQEEIILTLYYLHVGADISIVRDKFWSQWINSQQYISLLGRYFTGIITSKSLGTSQKKESEELWVKEILPELKLIVDSTEQDRERPCDQQKQKKYYSGKHA